MKSRRRQVVLLRTYSLLEGSRVGIGNHPNKWVAVSSSEIE